MRSHLGSPDRVGAAGMGSVSTAAPYIAHRAQILGGRTESLSRHWKCLKTRRRGELNESSAFAQAEKHRRRGARTCLVGLFGRPGVSAFRIRKEGRWEGKGIEFKC